ncbi:MAG TPA: prepilin-type N-terminal cleavage/methylation domain-containing protein [Candidatus Saccharimonadia bacterium]|nr:prepilin-type N-terminal cleavage/methylation domain-containing protein [Candidatus Saccharimonadia bacterium]
MSRLNQRGDTLVEVTLALAILAMVLTGAFVTANKAFNLGQDARERSQMVSDAQQQAEALESFRDSHTWSEFVLGNGGPLAKGINVGNGISCGGVTNCFHMVKQAVAGVSQWVPAAGPGTDTQLGGQGYVRIVVSPTPGTLPAPSLYNFSIQYGVPARGGGPDLASTIKLELVDIDRLRQ